MLDESAVFLAPLPTPNNVATIAEFVTCEVAIGERLFELLPRLDIVGRLLLLDLIGDRD